MGNTLGAASEFMGAGYRVFGLYGGNNKGECACGFPECKAAFKHPVASNWQLTPEWSEEQLEGLEALGHFDTGYGVLVWGLLVVDVDARNGGVKSFAQLCEDLNLDLSINCGLVVQTGSGQGSMHLYYKAPEGVSLVQTVKKYPGVDFKSSGFCVGPDSLHASGNYYQTVSGHPDDIGVAPEALVELLKRPDAYRASRDGVAIDVTDADLAGMLRHINCDCDRATWISIGMALHHATQGAGFELWDGWSSSGEKYPGAGNLRNQWDRFGKAGNPVTLGTIFYHAEQAGWKPEEEPLELPAGSWASDLAQADSVKKPQVVVETVVDKENTVRQLETRHPFHIDGVDLLRPPGFVGELCKWINNQSRFPRENLAAAAAIQTVANIAGLRYTDDLDGVTTNLITMCVAGSSTGKEAILTACGEIHQAAGIARATVGAIKSEQEIIRNLIDNQAAFYMMDEIGLILRTITQSKEAYHSGVVGTIMSAYSKAHSFLPLNGDTKRDVRKTLQGELRHIREMIDANEGDPSRLLSRLNQVERALKSIDNGLEKPFLSMMGFTTPITFDNLVTYEQATNGFIGRTVIIHDRDTNPRIKKGFKKERMSDRMRMTLVGLYDNGNFDDENYRVEYYGERDVIPTTAEAVAMLDAVADWSWEKAEHHRHTTGLESIPRRAREMVSKVSLILAAPGRIRTAEHVRWAYALIERDIREKCSLAHSNRMEELTKATSSDNMRLASMIAKIKARVGTDEWETIGALKNRIARGSEDLFVKALEEMTDKGVLECEEYKADHNGKLSKRIRLTEPQ